jgi:biotin transport system substrate-specific component
MLILAGGLITAALPWPGVDASLSLLPLPMTLQVPALLLTALVCGPRSAMLAAIAYLSLGLFQLPVFHGGGGLGYVLEPGFGYLVGFVPAAWFSGRLARQEGMDDPLRLFGISLLGLAVLQLVGLLNLLLGGLAGRWPQRLPQLLVSYSLTPLPTQVLLCCAVALLAWLLRRGLKLNP